MTKLERARSLDPEMYRRVWDERLGNVMRSWSASFVAAAALRRVPR